MRNLSFSFCFAIAIPSNSYIWKMDNKIHLPLRNLLTKKFKKLKKWLLKSQRMTLMHACFMH